MNRAAFDNDMCTDIISNFACGKKHLFFTGRQVLLDAAGGCLEAVEVSDVTRFKLGM